MNGLWRVVVEPKVGCHIQNFIVVDKEAKVQGQVQYKKKYEFRPKMCSDCYEEDYLRGNTDCKGVVGWEEYFVRFDKEWKEEMSKKGENRDRRVRKSTRELEDRAKEIESKNNELREKMSIKIAPERVKEMEEELADLRGQMQRFGEEKEKWKKERELMNLKDKEQYKSLQQFDEVINDK